MTIRFNRHVSAVMIPLIFSLPAVSERSGCAGAVFNMSRVAFWTSIDLRKNELYLRMHKRSFLSMRCEPFNDALADLSDQTDSKMKLRVGGSVLRGGDRFFVSFYAEDKVENMPDPDDCQNQSPDRNISHHRKTESQ